MNLITTLQLYYLKLNNRRLDRPIDPSDTPKKLQTDDVVSAKPHVNDIVVVPIDLGSYMHTLKYDPPPLQFDTVTMEDMKRLRGTTGIGSSFRPKGRV